MVLRLEFPDVPIAIFLAHLTVFLKKKAGEVSICPQVNDDPLGDIIHSFRFQTCCATSGPCEHPPAERSTRPSLRRQPTLA